MKKITREDLDKVLYAVSNPKIKNEKLQMVYQLGVLASWIYRLSRMDMTVRQELNSRFEIRQSQERK